MGNSWHAHLIAQHSFRNDQPQMERSTSEVSFPRSDVLRLTGTVPSALSPKGLEPQRRPSQRRKPKISRAPRWGAPRRRPLRTSSRTGQRWGTRRKVKRWTTNWLRQKSKNHLALLLLLCLSFGGWGGGQTPRLQNEFWFSSSLPIWSLSSPLCSASSPSPLSSLTTSWLRL